MFAEVANALLLTYLTTEYLINQGDNTLQRVTRPWNLLGLLTIVFTINVVERVTGLAGTLFQIFLHLPLRVLFVALVYTGVLYLDCQRIARHQLSTNGFFWKLGTAFLYILPVYPFLAVLISFGFLVLIRIFEVLSLPEDLLNWPIYYGTLYGPFSLVFLRVKRQVVEEQSALPAYQSRNR